MGMRAQGGHSDIVMAPVRELKSTAQANYRLLRGARSVINCN